MNTIQPKEQNVKILRTESIFNYFMDLSDDLDTAIMCKPHHVRLVTTDQALYEALGSLPDPSTMNHSKLIKFLEVVDIYPHRRKAVERSVLTHERVDEIRQSIKQLVDETTTKTDHKESREDAEK